MKLRAVTLALLISGLCLPSFGQSGASPDQPAYLKWDAGASAGFFSLHRQDAPYQEWDWQGMAWNLDAGRYLTTHVKAEGGVMWSPTYWHHGPPYNDRRRIRPVHFSTALTYQFLENAFAHPYVSFGVRTTVQTEHVERCLCTPAAGYSWETLAREHSIVTRPYIAAGYKSYFNERIYVRPELLFTLGSHGISHSSLRLGLGFDF
jgi:hypothetical protein